MNAKGKYEKLKKENWFYCSEAGRWTTALLVSGAILVTVFLLIHPVFMTIDDARLKYVYAGYSTGEPVDTYLFCYFPLSWLLSTLYTWLPAVPWYALYQFGIIGLSSAVIGKTVYKIFYRKKFRFFSAVLCHAVLYLSLALISTILMHFEITAAMAGTAGVVLLLGIDFQKDSGRTRLLDFSFSVLSIAACFTIQFNAFYSACCYLLVALVVAVLNALKNKTLKRTALQLACYLLCLAVAVAAVKVSDSMEKDSEEWQEYLAYNKYRVSFWDYPHTTYEEDPELFEEMGWTQEFYNLTQSMYFMDERFDKENLERFTQRFSWFDFEEPDKMLSTMVSTLGGLFRTERLVIVQTGFAVFLLVALLIIAASNKKWREYYPQMIGMLCCLGGTVLLTLYLASRGRLPLRAWLAVSIPCIAVTALLLVMTVEKPHGRGMRPKILRACVSTFTLLVWLAGMLWAYQEITGEDWLWRMQRNGTTMLMEDYAAQHPENIYVYDLMGAQNYSVFSAYPDSENRPSNAFVWGSSYIFTPAYQDQLENNGIDRLLTEDLFDENIYFIAHISGIYSNQLYEMLSKEYGPMCMEPVDNIADEFIVYEIYKVTE